MNIAKHAICLFVILTLQDDENCSQGVIAPWLTTRLARSSTVSSNFVFILPFHLPLQHIANTSPTTPLLARVVIRQKAVLTMIKTHPEEAYQPHEFKHGRNTAMASSSTATTVSHRPQQSIN